LLGGNPEFMAKKQMQDENFSDEDISFATSFIAAATPEQQLARDTFQKYLKKYKEITDKEKVEVQELGGLHIIGTERHESRRIDNQLRGRASRQGDPGSSVFFISLEDDLMRRFGGDWLKKVAAALKVDDSTPLQMRMLSKQIEKAQKRIEVQNYAIRKAVTQFDDVMNKQRELIYGERNKVIDGVDVHDQILKMFPDYVGRLVDEYIDGNKPYFEWELEPLNSGLEDKLFPKNTNLITKEFVDDCEPRDLKEKIVKVLEARLDDRKAEFEALNINYGEFERMMMLRVVDMHWMDHIDQMSILKNEIGLRQYGQQDPIVAYKKEGFELFDVMVDEIQEDVCRIVLNSTITVERRAPVEPQYKPVEVIENGPVGQAKSEKTTGRNDP